MAQDALTALDAAINQLEGELEGDPRFALLTRLRTARESFLAASDVGLFASGPPQVAIKPREDDKRRSLSPARAKAFQLCRKALTGHASPVRTRDLYEMVEQNGVSLPGGMANLSSFLSRHPEVFVGHGRAGWTLKDKGNGAEPDSGANGDGSAPLFNASQEGGEDHEATTTH